MSRLDRILADINAVEQDVDRAVAACEALDKEADKSWLPRLHQLLAHGDNFFVREAAAAPIARLEGLRALPQLLRALELGREDGHDNDGLGSLVSDLVWASPEQAAPVLSQMIREPSESQRSDAAWLWGFASKALTPEPLLSTLQDPSARVRSRVVGSLGSFKGREDVYAALVQSLRDPAEIVQCAAAGTLGYYGDERAVPVLRALLPHASPPLRRITKYALQQLAKVK